MLSIIENILLEKDIWTGNYTPVGSLICKNKDGEKYMANEDDFNFAGIQIHNISNALSDVCHEYGFHNDFIETLQGVMNFGGCCTVDGNLIEGKKGNLLQISGHIIIDDILEEVTFGSGHPYQATNAMMSEMWNRYVDDVSALGDITRELWERLSGKTFAYRNITDFLDDPDVLNKEAEECGFDNWDELQTHVGGIVTLP